MGKPSVFWSDETDVPLRGRPSSAVRDGHGTERLAKPLSGTMPAKMITYRFFFLRA